MMIRIGRRDTQRNGDSQRGFVDWFNLQRLNQSHRVIRKWVVYCLLFTVHRSLFTAYCLLFTVYCLLALSAGAVEAHAGGKMQLASIEAGPFKLTVWTSPDPARVGEVHVAAAVVSAEDALPILDGEVFIELIPLDGQGAVLSGQATTEASTNKFLYEEIFEIPAEEDYTVLITVRDSSGQQGEASFPLAVEPAPPLIFGIAAVLLLAAVTGGAVWFYLRSSADRPEIGNGNADDADGAD